MTPTRCVVDTNVATTASGKNPGAPMGCVLRSAKALERVMRSGHIFVDDAGAIVREYRNNLAASGEPGVGDAFLKWVLTHEYGTARCTRVAITYTGEEPTSYGELPAPPSDVFYDRSDRKFLAVAAASDERPAILQSFDVKWWGWRDALKSTAGVEIHFVCVDDIEAKYVEKFGDDR